MTHGNQLGSSLGSHDSSQARHLQRVALWVPRQCFEDFGLQDDKSAGFSSAFARGFRRNVDHSGPSGMIVMGELLRHLKTILLESVSSHGKARRFALQEENAIRWRHYKR